MNAEKRAAVLVPGGWGGQATPWMSYSATAVTARGGATHPITWEPPSSLYTQPEVVPGWVRERVEPRCDEIEAGVSGVIIGKSLGSHAASIAAERRLPAIWLTPLLHLEPVVAGLRAAGAPLLLIGGTADKSWNGELARELSPHVCEIERADHGFERPGEPLAKSAEALAIMGTAIETFLDEVVWPS